MQRVIYPKFVSAMMLFEKNSMKVILSLVFYFQLNISFGQINLDSIIETKTMNGFTFFVHIEDTVIGDFKKNALGKIARLNDKQKLSLIERLLEFKNEKNNSFISPILHSKKSDCYLFLQDTIGNVKFNITSLILINSIITNDYSLSPTYVLTKDSEHNLNMKSVKWAYRQYRKWYRKAKRKSMETMMKEGKFPLTNKRIYWVGSVCRGSK